MYANSGLAGSLISSSLVPEEGQTEIRVSHQDEIRLRECLRNVPGRNVRCSFIALFLENFSLHLFSCRAEN